MTSTLRLEEITPDNLDAAIGLRVHPEQEHLVAPVVKSLAEAYVHPGTAWPRLILDGDTPVGSRIPADRRNERGTDGGRAAAVTATVSQIHP
ncbi:hypothetical protein GCM10022207_69960 [Streptomyces lannensis]|uniref:GNAT family N-acetyltransferase n=1 Tax=Streptomyces lannensis TaxID=766498 RepID=A0ABP7L3H6_9ACTN